MYNELQAKTNALIEEYERKCIQLKCEILTKFVKNNVLKLLNHYKNGTYENEQYPYYDFLFDNSNIYGVTLNDFHNALSKGSELSLFFETLNSAKISVQIQYPCCSTCRRVVDISDSNIPCQVLEILLSSCELVKIKDVLTLRFIIDEHFHLSKHYRIL